MPESLDMPSVILLVLFALGELWAFTRNEPGERRSSQLLVVLATLFTAGVFGVLFWW